MLPTVPDRAARATFMKLGAQRGSKSASGAKPTRSKPSSLALALALALAEREARVLVAGRVDPDAVVNREPAIFANCVRSLRTQFAQVDRGCRCRERRSGIFSAASVVGSATARRVHGGDSHPDV